jgi:hypothetical protein
MVSNSGIEQLSYCLNAFDINALRRKGEYPILLSYLQMSYLQNSAARAPEFLRESAPRAGIGVT